jgi:DNA gyrase/topoisomerase IV subunit B
MTLQIKGTPSTPTFYHSDKTKTQPLGSRLKQWNLLEKGVIVSFYKKRQPDRATYYSRDGDLLY